MLALVASAAAEAGDYSPDQRDRYEMTASRSPTPETPVEDVQVKDAATTTEQPILEHERSCPFQENVLEPDNVTDLLIFGSGTLLSIDDAPQVDIVIVHGFRETQKSSWSSWKSEYSEWLIDQNGPQASNVLFFSYDASPILRGYHAKKTIECLALELLHRLLAERLKNSTHTLPIMFIAHDIGGSIVKYALSAAALDPNSFGDIFYLTRVLLFYECPHRAENHSNMANRLSQFLTRQGIKYTLPMLAHSTLHLAKAIMEVNHMFLDSKHILLSYVLSIYRSKDSEHDAFDEFAGTMGVPFEFRIEFRPNQEQNSNKIKEALLYLKSELEVNGIGNVRQLIPAASLLTSFKTVPEATNSFSGLIESTIYQSWRQQRSAQTLYLYGHRDITAASEYVFYDLDQPTQENRHVVLYFTFDHFDTRRNKLQNLLATFLAQVAGHYPSSPRLETLGTNILERNWSTQTLLQLFEKYRQNRNIGDISFVINHFDECEPTSRKAFLDFIFDLGQRQEVPWKCLITSRVPEALLDELSRTGSYMDLAYVTSTLVRTPQVVNTLADTMRSSLLASNPELRYYNKLLDQELYSTSNLAPGVRRLIFKHMSAKKGWPSQTTIHETFGDVASLTLQLALERILETLSSYELAKQALRWVLCSSRPLTICEFRDTIDLFIQQIHQKCSSQPKSYSVNTVLESLAGIVSCEDNELGIEQVEIRDLFPADVTRDAHVLISRMLLRYLGSDYAREKLMGLNRVSKHRGTRITISCDRTNLCSYAVKFLPYHLAQAVKDSAYDLQTDLESFVRSPNMQPWLISFWAMENPVTRSQQPYTTIYPILVGAGMLKQVESLMDIKKDTAAGMVEACLHGHFDDTHNLLSRISHSTETLKKLLTVAGSEGTESNWIRIIEYIKTKHVDFPWKDQESLVRRAAEIGCTGALRALIAAKCPLEGSLPLTSFYRSPLMRAAADDQPDAVNILLEYGADPNFGDDTGWRALHYAMSTGSFNVIEPLYHGKGDMDIRNDDLETPLLLACTWGCFRAAKILLSLGANPDIGVTYDDEELGWTPLITAINKKHTECARSLIEGNANLEDISEVGSALVLAIRNQLLGICEMLVEKKANLKHPGDKQSALGTVLNSDTKARRLEILNLLIQNGANVNEIVPGQDPPLIQASWLEPPDNLAVVDLLLCNGADVNSRSQEGARPIEIAVTQGDITLVRRFLEEKNVELEALGGSWTPLKLARGKLEITNLLLEAGANPIAAPENEEPPIMWAVRDDNVEIARLLIHHGAVIDPAEASEDDWEPLEYAVSMGQTDMIRVLCDGGANKNRQWSNKQTLVHKAMQGSGLAALLEFRPDINVQDEWGDTPIHEIKSTTSLDDIKLLVRAGADINIANKKNITPLVKAMQADHETAADFLLSRNPDLNIASPFWGGPLHWACCKRKPELAEKLIKAGADVNLAVPGWASTPLMSTFLGDCVGHHEHNDEIETRLFNLLMASGAEIEATAETFGNVVGAVAFRGSTAMLKLILKRGGQAGVADIMGRLPLHYAALRGDLERVDVLLDAGEDAASVDCTGRNALFWAVQGGSLEMIDRILEKVDKDCINQEDNDGWTPLCWAARGGFFWTRQVDEETQSKVIQKLLDNYAPLEVKIRLPERAWTPLGIARYHGRSQKILDLLTPECLDSVDNQSDLLDNQIPRSLTDWEEACDYCFQKISGIQYCCTLCTDFFLCYKCYNSRHLLHNTSHEFTTNGPEYSERTPTPSETSSNSSEIVSESASEPDETMSIREDEDGEPAASEPDDLTNSDENSDT